MRFSLYSDAKPSLKFALILLICITGFLAFYLFGSLLIYLLFGYDGLQMIQSLNPLNEKSLTIIKILQVSQSIGFFIVPSLILAFLFSEKPFSYLGFRKPQSNILLYSVTLTIFALPAINLLGSLNMLVDLPEKLVSLEKKAQELTMAFMATKDFPGFLFNVFMIALLPAIGEELLFRGILQKVFGDWTRSAFWGIFISAMLFSVLHLQFQGFIPRLALGLIFGLLYYWTGSLWIPITAHFVNNFIAIVGYTLINQGSIPHETENIGGLSQMWSLGVFSLFTILGLMWLIRREVARG